MWDDRVRNFSHVKFPVSKSTFLDIICTNLPPALGIQPVIVISTRVKRTTCEMQMAIKTGHTPVSFSTEKVGPEFCMGRLIREVWGGGFTPQCWLVTSERGQLYV